MSCCLGLVGRSSVDDMEKRCDVLFAYFQAGTQLL